MSLFDLPDLPDYPPKEPKMSKPANPRFQQLLNSSQLADWAGEFLQRLANRYSEESLLRGLALVDPATGAMVPRYLRSGEPEARWLDHFLTSPDVDPTVQQEWLKQGFLADDPKWLTQLLERDRAQVSRIFLLSGNISDYAYDPVVGYRPGIRLLSEALECKKDAVLTLSLSKGLSLRSKHKGIEQRLPKSVQGWIKRGGGFNLEHPLIGQICDLFDQLRRWLEEENNLRAGVAIIFENIHLLIPSEGVTLERNFLVDTLLSWSVSPILFHRPHCLILTAEFLEDVSHDLRSRGGKIDQIVISRPSSPETRLKFILPLLQPKASMSETRRSHSLELRGYPGHYVEKLNKLAKDTAGLTLIGIEDMVQQAASSPGYYLNSEGVMAAKRERLQQESDGLLEVMTPDRTLDQLAGYQPLKNRLREVIRSLRNSENDPTIPMGILFLGPPGTGKTVAAKAIAGESKINMAKLGDFRGMYVGESERNLSRLLSLIESLHPVIIFMDELDQSEGNRGEGGDSGVSRRVFGKLLEFMSDTTHRGKILWIGASNRPDLIDPAMKRPGRFDLVLPFLLPDRESRQEIFKIILPDKVAKIPHITVQLTNQEYDFLAGETQNYSGAEIEALIGEVLRRAMQRRLRTGAAIQINRQDFENVLKVYIPPQSQKKYKEWENQTLLEVRTLDLLPPEYQQRLRNLREINEA